MTRATVFLAGSLLLSLLAYWPSLHGEFVFDDQALLVDNDCHHSLRRIPKLFTTPGIGVCTQRPLRFASFAVDYALWGDNVIGYHLTNVVLHGVCAWLALLLLLRLTGDRLVALMAATFFALHPIATEAVAYISGRRDLLMALLLLLAALLFEAFREKGGWWRLALLLLAQLGALFSNESAAALPLLLTVLEICRAWPSGERRGRALTRALLAPLRSRARWPLLLLLLLVAGFSFWTVKHHNFSERAALWGPTVAAHVGTVLRVHLHYLHQLLLPTDLIADYSPDAFPVSTSLLEVPALVALGVVAGLLVLAYLTLPRWPLLAGAVLSYFLLLLPTSQLIVHHELLAEHRLYLPSLCYCAVVAALIRHGLRRSTLVWALAASLGMAGVFLCWSRSLDWTSSERLWTVTVRQVPRASRALANLGVVFARQHRFAEARPYFEEALSIRPEMCEARLVYGQLLADLGETARVLPELRRAAACRPAPRFLAVLGFAALRAGRAKEAAANFRRVLTVAPNDVSVRQGLARAEAQLRGKP